MGVISRLRLAGGALAISMALAGQSVPHVRGDLAARWMAFRGKVWGGEIGHLQMTFPEDRVMPETGPTCEVLWVRKGLKATITTYDLLNFEDDPSGEVAAVFARRGDWLLVRGLGGRGWGWIRFNPDSMVFTPVRGSRDWVEVSERYSGGHSLLLIGDQAGPLREVPHPRSQIALDLRRKPWRRYSEHRGYGWSPDSTWIRVMEQRGDWVRVCVPRSEEKVPGVEEETYTLKLEWDSGRTGWVKWKRPGPVLGTWSSWIKLASIGTYD